MKQTKIILTLSIPLVTIACCGGAEGAGERPGADLVLEPTTVTITSPAQFFPYGTVINGAMNAGNHSLVRSAGVSTVAAIDEMLNRTKTSITAVANELEDSKDPLTRAVLRTQFMSLTNAKEALAGARRGAEAIAGVRALAGKGLWLDGHQLSSSLGRIQGYISALNAEMGKAKGTVDELTNGATAESIETKVNATKEALANGTVATGGVLTSPGATAGVEKIIITEGVTNRTITGQHGDLLMHGIGSGEATLRETPELGETKRSASLLMLGEHQEAKISAGESAILIGDNSKTEGNGIAIGKNATSANDAIALGNDSVATRANELSIGNDDGLNRKITHMADGTNDSDGATIHNVNEATGLLENRLTESIGTSHDNAIRQAKKYTDDTTSDANDKVLREATAYTDDTAKETLKTANEHTERRAVIAENNAVTRSNTYTDESSSRTLEKANTYTNHQVAQAENNAVTRSNDYTNKRFGELKHQVDRNEKRANGGIAGAMAMTAIPSVPGHNFSFGMAASGYRDQGAIAAGVKANITQDTTVSLNTAWDSGNGVGVAAGVSVGW
ncbi:hypothetical protein S726_004129 [Salmonella enterica subsp. enterica]|nr:hypothetical protein [Salmonella enterica subsp. enterica]